MLVSSSEVWRSHLSELFHNPSSLYFHFPERNLLSNYSGKPNQRWKNLWDVKLSRLLLIPTNVCPCPEKNCFWFPAPPPLELFFFFFIAIAAMLCIDFPLAKVFSPFFRDFCKPSSTVFVQWHRTRVFANTDSNKIDCLLSKLLLIIIFNKLIVFFHGTSCRVITMSKCWRFIIGAH